MDDSVKRAMLRWPDVPAVAGWLRLDARGDWLVKNAATDDFERISNRQIIAFIERNYGHDEQGRYLFQNGPQCVYVTLAYTPYVFRINDDQSDFVSHTNAPAAALRSLLLDEAGRFLLDAALGVGVVLDRDLGLLVSLIRDVDGAVIDPDTLVALATHDTSIRLFGQVLRLAGCVQAELPRRFGYVVEPTVTGP